MSTLAARLMANTRVTNVSPPNRVREVMKLDNGGLRVTLHSGKTFELAKEDELFQTFIVYSVLAEL
jgi:hypothetical protein